MQLCGALKAFQRAVKHRPEALFEKAPALAAVSDLINIRKAAHIYVFVRFFFAIHESYARICRGNVYFGNAVRGKTGYYRFPSVGGETREELLAAASPELQGDGFEAVI